MVANYVRRIFIILTILFAGLIFYMSSRPDYSSQQDSLRISVEICEIGIEDYDKMSPSEQEVYLWQVDHLVRKTAHFTEYALLAFLVCGCLGKSDWRHVRAYLLPWGIATAYAASDEFHQRFVPGRHGCVSDVCLDSFGAISGVLVYVMCVVVLGKMFEVLKDWKRK